MQIFKLGQLVFAAALFAALLAFSASAQNQDDQGENQNSQGENDQGKYKEPGGKSKGSLGAPAPIAGGGIISLGAAGVVYWVIRRRRQRSGNVTE